MAIRERHHQELDRYLLDGERLVTAVHQHWGKVAEPVATAVVASVAALWVDSTIEPRLHVLGTMTWWVWFAVLLRLLYKLAEWRHDWFVATDKRLLLFNGFITRKVSMMPLMKVTDMSYERSVPGRLLGYGRFIMESAGQDQALREVNWVPQPDAHYRAICAEIFGVSDHVAPREIDPWAEVVETWEGGGDGPPLPPDPSASWHDDAPLTPPRAGSLYRSPDLRARDRSADTGPIPLYRPRDEYDD